MKLDRKICTRIVSAENPGEYNLLIKSEGLRLVKVMEGKGKVYCGIDFVRIPLGSGHGGALPKLPTYVRVTFDDGNPMRIDPSSWECQQGVIEEGFYGFWDNNELSPEMIESAGQIKILNDWDFYLVQEDGDNTKIIGKLMKNNLFRFADGSYAPTVLCAKGEATEPWETDVDHHYAIVRAWNTDKYLLHGNTEGGRTIYGIFNDPVSIEGCISIQLEKTGICADLPTLYNGELRCIPMKGIDTGCGRGSEDGHPSPCSTFERGSYHARNASYLTNMEKARSKNTVQTSVNVFSEQMLIHRMSHTVANILKNGTYDLHAIDKYSTGISENCYINEEEFSNLYGKVTGFRWKFEGGAEWNTAVGDNGGPSDWYFDSERNYNLDGNIYSWLNQYYSYTQVLEPQCALSYAAEKHIAAGTLFMYNGRKWHYEDVPGSVGLLDGEMNARLFMHFDDEGSGLTDTTWYLSGYDKDGNAKNLILQGIFEIGVVDGYISWGGDWEPSGGEEVVSHCYKDSGDNEVQEVGFYLCTRQHELTADLSINYADIPDDEPFDFMETYSKVGQFINEFPSGWTSGGCLPFTFLGKENGGDMHTGNCSYAYARCAAKLGKLYRQTMWLRGIADSDFVSARYCNYFHYSPVNSDYDYAFAYQIRLKGLE